MPKFRLACSHCGETVLLDDKFCFHCGTRLPSHPFLAMRHRLVQIGLSQWPLAIIGTAALLGSAYIVRHQSLVVAEALHNRPHLHGRSSPVVRAPLVHAVIVETTTTRPGNAHTSATPHSAKPAHQPLNASTSGSWVTEHASYQNIQVSLRVPWGTNPSRTVSPSSWAWGERNTPYHATVSVVSKKPGAAKRKLGPQTYGTPITRSATLASQTLVINWSGEKWLEVAIAVPSHNINWLATIAESIRIS